MKQRVMAIFPPEFHTDLIHFHALAFAFVYVTLAILQLFTFEDFSSVTAGFGLPGGAVTAVMVALALPIAEIAALPYLLSMRPPRHLYQLSRAFVLIAAGLWVCIVLWTNITGNNATNLGLFGATLDTPNQWWSLAFVALLAWGAWFMFEAKPIRRKQHPKTIAE
ncbi:MAG: hypothetical protein ABIP74_05115 [Candidatus Saccharimonas sp.]